MPKFNKVVIKEIRKETEKAVSILFDITKNIESEYSFRAGQYIILRKKLNGEEIRRSYSICLAPNEKQIRVVVKLLEGGKFSKYATTSLKVGDEIDISKPEGRFVIKVSPNKNYIAFAAGSGITPIISMIKTVLTTEQTSTFTLIYGNKSIKDTIFFEELNQLKLKFPNTFNLHFIYSVENVKNNLRGRINQSVTNYFVKNMYRETCFDAAFLCGPEEMIKEVSKTLENNNIYRENIYFELFTTSLDKNIESSETKKSSTDITVLLDYEETTFAMQQSDTILASVLRRGIDAPYSCEGGICGSCMCKVIEGKAIMEKNSVLTESEIEEGVILSCQAHPVTSKITISFDDI